MSEIYLVRHAIAEKRGAAWPDDDLRPLTREGIDRFASIVRGLATLDVELDQIFTSPLVRARQTAELLSAGLPGRPSITVISVLAPGTPLNTVGRAVLRVRGRRVAFVGHEPDLGALAAHLIGAQRQLAFKKGAVCRIDVPSRGPAPRGALVWFAPPSLLRRAAR
jgi:phosphohistidine phosphatase